MHRTDCAEFLLSRFTSREYAAAIVGDLIEIDSSQFRFWSAVTRTAIALSARSWLGVLTAVGACFLARRLCLSSWRGLPPGFFTPCTMLLSMIAAYSAVRQGLTDPVTKAAAAMLVFSSLAVFLRGIAWVPVAGDVLAGVFILALVVTAQGRKVVLRVLFAGMAALGGGWTAGQLMMSIFAPDQNSMAHSYWPLGLLDLGSAVGIAAVLPPSSVQQANSRGSAVE